MGALALAPADDACCPRCTATARWLRDAADQLGLREWELTFEHDSPDDPCARATCEIAEHVRSARVRVVSWFWALEPGERAYTLAHELAHLLVTDLQEAVRRGAREAVGGPAFRTLMAQVDHEAERLVDAVARAVLPLLPPAPGG